MRYGTTAGAALLILWLIIGVLAAAQRGYFDRANASCPKAGTTVITVLAGPLNYVGVNPKMDCEVPQPSK